MVASLSVMGGPQLCLALPPFTSHRDTGVSQTEEIAKGCRHRYNIQVSEAWWWGAGSQPVHHCACVQ